jgi:hypothetical protein
MQVAAYASDTHPFFYQRFDVAIDARFAGSISIMVLPCFFAVFTFIPLYTCNGFTIFNHLFITACALQKAIHKSGTLRGIWLH